MSEKQSLITIVSQDDKVLLGIGAGVESRDFFYSIRDAMVNN